eukprot:8173009-Pyramimonas_sp.AAC.1
MPPRSRAAHRATNKHVELKPLGVGPIKRTPLSVGDPAASTTAHVVVHSVATTSPAPPHTPGVRGPLSIAPSLSHTRLSFSLSVNSVSARSRRGVHIEYSRAL